MGFFGRIFARREQKVLKLRLDEVESFLQNSTEKQGKQLEQGIAGKKAEIKHLLSELRAALGRLRNASVETENKRLQKIVETAKRNAERQLLSLIEKLQPPSSSDAEIVRKYCTEASILLQRELRVFGKNIAYTSVSLKQEVKQIGSVVKQIDSVFSEAQRLFDASEPVLLQQGVKKALDELREKVGHVSALSEEVGVLEKGLAEAEQRLKATQRNLDSLRQGKEFLQIKALNEKKSALLHQKQQAKTEVIDLFSKVEKPLHRMRKAANAGKFVLPKDIADFLNNVMLNPFNALKKDPKALKLKQLLQETEQAIGQGLIDFKEHEKEKRLSALREARSFDFFERVFWRFNQIDSQLAGIEGQLRHLPVVKKEAELLAQANEDRKRSAEKRAALEEKTALLRSESQQIPQLKQAVQNLLQDAAGKKIELVD